MPRRPARESAAALPRMAGLTPTHQALNQLHLWLAYEITHARHAHYLAKPGSKAASRAIGAQAAFSAALEQIQLLGASYPSQSGQPGQSCPPSLDPVTP